MQQETRAKFIFSDETWEKMKADPRIKETADYIFGYVSKQGTYPNRQALAKNIGATTWVKEYFQEYENFIYFLGYEKAPIRMLYDKETEEFIDEDNLLNLYNKHFLGRSYWGVKDPFTKCDEVSHYHFVEPDKKDKFLQNQKLLKSIDGDTLENRIKLLEKQDAIHRGLATKYKDLWFYCDKENKQLKKELKFWEEKTKDKIDALAKLKAEEMIGDKLEKIKKERKRHERRLDKIHQLHNEKAVLEGKIEKMQKEIEELKQENR